MSAYRRAAKVDRNQPEIVKDLRKMGYSVALGHDDVLVGKNGRTYWYEIKASEKAKIQDSQIKLLETWRGHYQIVSSLEQIIEDIKKRESEQWQHH